ncbi:Cytokinin dehydrogenase [Asimina triloba]
MHARIGHSPTTNHACTCRTDIAAGKGEILTCSKHLNAELFHGVLGGLGQFGIITRARIALGPAPSRVRWMRLLYTEFSAFTRDQERLISMSGDGKEGFDYVEGSVVSDESLINNWRSSFFSPRDHGRICSLAAQHPIIYSLEVAKYYHDDPTAACVHQDVDLWIEGLSYVPGFAFENDVSFVEFLNRVRHGELKLRSKGLWDVPHPWLNLFVPGSRIRDFDAGVFKGILRKNASSTGPILVYPMNKNKWNEEMSAVTTDEEIFYSVGLLRSATKQNLESYQDQNREILRFCEKEGIEVKQYLPHYEAMDEWQKHFGAKWNKFLQRKRMFDPKGILEAGPMIFNKFS